MSGPVDFHFDFSSPYAYFASTRIDALAARHGRACRWRPMLLGPAFRASGNQPLADQPLKGAYSRHDWDRLSRLWQVPYRAPDRFPVATQAAARVFLWLDAADGAAAKAFGARVFAAYFAEGRPIDAADLAADLAAEMGHDRAQARAAVDDPAWKDLLRRETDGAVAAGVFGAPFFVVDGEGFWGADRLWMVEEWLARGGW